MKISTILTNLFNSNVYILKKHNCCLIVDCGAELTHIKEVVKNAKVDGILLTHGHFDHSAFCNEYANAFGTKIYASEKAKMTMSDKDANYSEDKSVIEDFSNFVFIDKDCKVKIGEFDVECIIAEGHSPCSICYKIGEFLFAGDVLFDNGIGSIQLINSNKQDMLASLSKLENVNFENCYSGHGNPSDHVLQHKNIKIYKRFLSR